MEPEIDLETGLRQSLKYFQKAISAEPRSKSRLRGLAFSGDVILSSKDPTQISAFAKPPGLLPVFRNAGFLVRMPRDV